MRPYRRMWAVAVKDSLLPDFIKRTRGEVIADATYRYKKNWDTLRKEGFRAVEVSVTIIK